MTELPPPPPAPTPTPAPAPPVQASASAPMGLPNMRGRLILMATLAAVSVYGAVTGPLEASPAPAGTVTEVAAPSTTEPAPVVSAEPDPSLEDDPETALEAEPVEEAPVAEPEPEPAPAAETSAEEPTPEPEAAPETTAPAGDSYTGPVQTGSPFVDAFDTQASHWRAVNGSWAVQNGLFVQSDPSGFDLINELMIELPETYNISVRMHAVGDVALGGGVIVGMETTGSRRGAYLVDFTAGGEFLRWGRYDLDTGIYKYLGGLAVGPDLTQWHTLRVKVGANESTVFFNGDPMGTFDPVNGGHAALVTSESSVEFDDLLIEVL